MLLSGFGQGKVVVIIAKNLCEAAITAAYAPLIAEEDNLGNEAEFEGSLQDVQICWQIWWWSLEAW